MNRVIKDASLGAAPVRLDASAVHFVDGALAEHLAQAEAAAYQRGLHDGAAAARADMAAIAARFEAAINGAIDRRTYATPAHVVTLGGELPASPGLIDRRTVAVDRMWTECVVVDVPSLGGGTSGETVFVLVNGATRCGSRRRSTPMVEHRFGLECS